MSDEGIVYRVGDATDHRDDDSTFLEYEAAEEDALIHSAENDYVVAIWQVHERTGHAETLRLVFQDCVWFPDH